MIRVVLVDDHVSFREALAFMLGREPDITVVGQAGSVSEARPSLHDVDVAIIDIGLPDGSGVDLIRWMHEVDVRCVSMVLTGSALPPDIARAVEAGAAGVVHKTVSVAEIIAAVRRLAAGEQLMSPQETVALLRYAQQHRDRERDAELTLGRLTSREREVLQALAEGLSDKDIAQRLHLRNDTIRTHMTSILGKLGVRSRLQALLFAIRHGAVSLK